MLRTEAYLSIVITYLSIIIYDRKTFIVEAVDIVRYSPDDFVSAKNYNNVGPDIFFLDVLDAKNYLDFHFVESYTITILHQLSIYSSVKHSLLQTSF